MSIASALLPERDGKDLGFLQLPKSNEVHYFRSRSNSTLAISHCGLIRSKEQLLTPTSIEFCHYCEMIEQMRDERQE